MHHDSNPKYWFGDHARLAEARAAAGGAGSGGSTCGCTRTHAFSACDVGQALIRVSRKHGAKWLPDPRLKGVA